MGPEQDDEAIVDVEEGFVLLFLRSGPNLLFNCMGDMCFFGGSELVDICGLMCIGLLVGCVFWVGLILWLLWSLIGG